LAPDPIWRLDDAVRATIAYADIFGFALTDLEVHRDLVGIHSTPADVAAAVRYSVTTGAVEREQEYLTLVGRRHLVERRMARTDVNRQLWPRARSFGQVLAMLPFVRLVGVTGSLAANNAAADADIDYLLIASPDRLWFVRALAIGMVRLVRLAGIRVCPNYLLTTNALALTHHDIYTAHELLQMVPLSGKEVYAALRAQNRWVNRLLPNRSRLAISVPPVGSTATAIKRTGERAFGGAIGSRLDQWESQRKIARFRASGTQGRFTRDICEGHFGRHRDNIEHEWQRRCDRLGLTVPWIASEPVQADSVEAMTSWGSS
jgi:hypothetical protein